MAIDLKGRTALVTGAGRGIGRAVARKLAAAGASVMLNDLDRDVVFETGMMIDKEGGAAKAMPGDITAPDFPEKLVIATLNGFGSIDIIVNNAGYTWDNVIQKTTDEQWYAMIDVHMTAPFRVLRAAADFIRTYHKAEAAEGQEVFRKVVNISSLAGVGGNAGQVGYGAAKAGINGMTRVLAKEWGRFKVTVNSVAFGLIRTRLTEAAAGTGSINIEGEEIKVGVNPDVMQSLEKGIPLGRGGTPAEAAAAVYLFCIPESDYISGQTLVCSGGYML